MVYKIKGFMYDAARGMKGDADYLENLMRRLVEYGYNMLVINLEYRFKFPSHPEIGPADSLSSDDVRKLDKVAQELGIELVPFLNCAGHCEGIFTLEKYKNLCADPSGVIGTVWQSHSTDNGHMANAAEFAAEQILIGDDSAIVLVKELYCDLMDCFSSKYFHIGFDEVRQMHIQMPCSDENEQWNEILKHLLCIIDFVKSKGKIPILWGDMFTQNPNRHQYIKQLPEGIIVCAWEYANEDKTFENMTKYLELFKKSGVTALLSPAVNGFRGNPVMSHMSTGNIRKLNAAVKKVYGDCAPGILLCHWESNFGGCFSAHWPWIYLQGTLFNDADCQDFDDLGFLRDYTRIEWGADSDLLEKWYNLIETDVNNAVKCYGVNCIVEQPWDSYHNLNELKRKLFRTKNILRELQDARQWLAPEAVSESLGFIAKGKAIAYLMYQKSANRRDEPKRLLEWTTAYEAIFKLMNLIEELNNNYSLAAGYQGNEGNRFKKHIIQCIHIMSLMLDETKTLQMWAEATVVYENCVVEEKWWIVQAQFDLKRRMVELLSTINNNYSLINFNRFVRFEPDIPNRVHHR